MKSDHAVVCGLGGKLDHTHRVVYSDDILVEVECLVLVICRQTTFPNHWSCLSKDYRKVRFLLIQLFQCHAQELIAGCTKDEALGIVLPERVASCVSHHVLLIVLVIVFNHIVEESKVATVYLYW